MVLLSPSISALRKLLRICENYAESHGLLYNVKKSELLVFKSKGSSVDDVPAVTINGVFLNRVMEFRYLGHLITEDFNDNKDIERERRALAIRCNMIARKFSRCTRKVKLTLFRAYCQTFYTCSLWVSYTQRAYNDLRIQYNNGFRVLLGLPRSCSASQMFAENHVDDFYAIMRKRSASMMSRMRGSSNNILKILTNKWENPFVHQKYHEYNVEVVRKDGLLLVRELAAEVKNHMDFKINAVMREDTTSAIQKLAHQPALEKRGGSMLLNHLSYERGGLCPSVGR
ncbi:jg10764 [Pararge aegeria aegeria]|uniref:Jg10764 protein n=1 Tax=Pararge aegeria aegeria TaxID=348720 RepID=A0A8S4RIF7_9NEOP|nr:jg10764 [Pararge aegeria aegeria]